MKASILIIAIAFISVHVDAKPVENSNKNSNFEQNNMEFIHETQLSSEEERNSKNDDSPNIKEKKSISIHHSHDKANKCFGIIGRTTAERKNFTEEISYDFLFSGDIEALDEMLSYLVRQECFSENKARAFRKQLIVIYDLIMTQDSDDDHNFERQYSELRRIKEMMVDLDKRSEQSEYFENLSSTISSLAELSENGDVESLELLKYMLEFVGEVHKPELLTYQQANELTDMILKALEKNPEANIEEGEMKAAEIKN